MIKGRVRRGAMLAGNQKQEAVDNSECCETSRKCSPHRPPPILVDLGSALHALRVVRKQAPIKITTLTLFCTVLSEEPWRPRAMLLTL